MTVLKLTFKLHSWNSSLMKAFTRSDAAFRKSYWAGFENQMHSMLCKYTENFFFHFFYDLSLLQKFTYYSANDKKVLSESASFKNVPVPWAENLEVTLLAFGNPFHTETPADMTPKVASSAILFQTVRLMSQLEILLVFYIQSLVCLLPPFSFSALSCFLKLGL